MFRTKKEIFSIRKTALGIGSVLLGVMLTSHVASAEEVSQMTRDASTRTVLASAAKPILESQATQSAAVTPTSTSSTTTSSPTSTGLALAAITAPTVSETPIMSPIRYVSDPNQPVGYRLVQAQGKDGKIITTQTGTLDVNGNPVITVERIDPTETVIVLGTQTTSVVTSTQPATTVYSIDVTKPLGTNVIIPAVDGKTITSTTNKIETTSTAPVSPAVTSEAYKWIDQSFYHVDTSQALPSDRITVDKLFVPLPPLTPTYNTKESTVREFAQYAENYMYDHITVTNPDGSTSQKQVMRIVTGEMLDPTNNQLRTVLGLSDDNAFYSRLFNTSKEDLWNTSAQDYGLEIVPKDLSTSTDDFLRYHNSNIINDALYADIKADYLRAQLAYNQLQSLGTLTTTQESDMDLMTSQFKTLTDRYNNYKDSIAIAIDYSHTMMADSQKVAFEATLKTLPEEVQRIISRLTIYDDQIPGMGSSTLGLANSADQSIALKYDSNNSEMLATVLHEMSHIIDFKSGIYQETSDRNTDNVLNSVMGLSDSQEFLDVYHTYFKRPDVWSYYRDHSEEAFAEGFSQYLMHRFYGTPYTRYVFNPSTGDAYSSNDGSGYSPFAATEFYFASLYHRLFDYPRTAQVIPYLVSTRTTAPVNGQVVYGAMPEEKTTMTAYKTVYVGDTSFAYDPTGRTDRVQAGVDGTETIRTSYALDNNNQLVATQTVMSSTSVQDEIITKGIQPTVTDTKLAMTVIYQEVTDGSLGDWQVKVLDSGQDGLLRTTRTYHLDPVTGVITATSTESTVRAMKPMIIQYQVGSNQVIALSYQTKIIEDKTLDRGLEKVIQRGADGKSIQFLKSYRFVELGDKSYFTDIVYNDAVMVVSPQDYIIVKGNKAKTVQATTHERHSTIEKMENEKVPEGIMLQSNLKEMPKASHSKTPIRQAKKGLPVTAEKDSSLLTLMAGSIILGLGLKLKKKENE